MLDTGPLAVPAVFAHTTPVTATEAQKGTFLIQIEIPDFSRASIVQGLPKGVPFHLMINCDLAEEVLQQDRSSLWAHLQ